jgi:hypothetical protein
MPKYFDGFGRNVSAYVADLEAKAVRLQKVEAELAAARKASDAAAVNPKKKKQAK